MTTTWLELVLSHYQAITQTQHHPTAATRAPSWHYSRRKVERKKRNTIWTRERAVFTPTQRRVMHVAIDCASESAASSQLSSRQSALTNSASDGPAASTSRRVTVRLCLGARRVKRAESVAAQRRDGRYLLHLGLFEAHCWPPGPRASVIATVVHCPSVPVWRDHGAFDIAELAVARARLEHVEASARSSPQRAARTAVWRLIRRAARAALPGATTVEPVSAEAHRVTRVSLQWPWKPRASDPPRCPRRRQAAPPVVRALGLVRVG